MSIIKQVQEFLSQYQGFVLLTDILEGNESCTIFPIGSSVTEDTIGSKEYIREFKVIFQKSLIDEASRQANHEWLEGFCDWIEEQIDNSNYPDLGSGLLVTGFAFYDLLFNPTEDFKDGVYSLLIRLTYTKEER